MLVNISISKNVSQMEAIFSFYSIIFIFVISWMKRTIKKSIKKNTISHRKFYFFLPEIFADCRVNI
jgi:hypothetical protein